MTDQNRISDDQHNNAPAVPQGWVKASDRMPLDGYSDGLREIADELDAVQKDLAGIELQADGNANFYWLMRDGKWIAKIQMNGEMLVDKQVALLEAMLSAGTQIAHCPKCFTCFEVGSGSTEQNPWRDAVIEQLESWHICVPAIHDNSPRLAIKALVNIETKAALDPAVSSEAAALVAGQHNNAPAPAQGEPFGYFRAEPFGWTDCSEDADGAIALYERPAAPAVPQGEPVAWLDLSKMSASAMVYATGWKSNDKQSPLYTAPAPAPAQLTDEEIADIQDRLVAVSGYVADQDDRSAQAILKGTLKMLAAIRAKGASDA